MAVVGGNAIDHAKAYAGLGVTFEVNNIVGRLNASDVIIPFGKGVVTDTSVTSENAARLPVVTDNASDFNGVAFYALNRAYQDDESIGAVPKRSFDVMTMGEIWVYARTTVAKDDPVFLIVGDTGANNYHGDFINVATSGTYTGVELTDAKFTSAGSAGDLVKIAIKIGG